MYRSFMNEGKPANIEEMRTAIEETELDVSSALAMINEPDEDAVEPFIGWTADITGESTDVNNDDVVTIETAGFETKKALISMLEELEIDIDIDED